MSNALSHSSAQFLPLTIQGMLKRSSITGDMPCATPQLFSNIPPPAIMVSRSSQLLTGSFAPPNAVCENLVVTVVPSDFPLS